MRGHPGRGSMQRMWSSRHPNHANAIAGAEHACAYRWRHSHASLWKTRMRDCHSRDRTTKTMQDKMGIFSRMFGRHSPVLSMLRCGPCGDWGEDERNVRDATRLRIVIGVCQTTAWKRRKAELDSMMVEKRIDSLSAVSRSLGGYTNTNTKQPCSHSMYLFHRNFFLFYQSC